MVAASAATAGNAQVSVRHIVAVGAGNALGFYDFLVFSFFSVQIARTVFPEGDGSSGLLLAPATFGAGFLTRPVGAIVLGRLGDRIGRKPAMMISLTLTGVAVIGQAMVPSYAAAGIAAPILMLLLRMLVGFGLGGEVGPSTAFLVEAAPPHRRGFYVSLQYVTQDASVLFAGIVGYVLAQLLGPAELDAYGWRIAFALGAAAVPLALYIRAHLPETLDAEELHPSPAVAHHASRPNGLLRLAVLSFGILAMASVGAYVTTYMTTYAQNTLQMAANIAFEATIAIGIAGIIFDALGGWLSDRFGRKPVMMSVVAVYLLTIMPAFMFLEASRTNEALFAVSFVIGAFNAMAGAPALVAITESLPKASRSAGLAIVYALGISVFGGSTQFVVTWIIATTANPLAPAWYLIVSQLVLLTAMAFLRESAPGHAKPVPQ